MKSPIFDYLARYGFKKVVLCQNTDVGLRGIIAIHSTYLGPATGGLRMWVVGSANNQLAEERHGDLLGKRGILYAPDYIANAGGTILDTDRLLKGGFNRDRAMRNVARIGDRMRELIALGTRERIPTSRAADRLAEERLAMARSLRMI